MLETIRYVNHLNETLDFIGQPLLVNANDLRDFAWNIISKNNRISGFKKGIVKKTLPVIIKCMDHTEGLRLRDRLFEICEKDVRLNEYGKLMIGNYYLRCFVTGSQKSDYRVHGGYMLVKLTIQTDLTEWIKETKTSFGPQSSEGSGFLDYLFDFPLDFKNSLRNNEINNTGIVASDFIMTIYGYVSKPTLYIAGHEYTVSVDVEAGEYLTIDSMNKTITLTKNDGTKINCFSKRKRDSYIFEKIPAGVNDITSPNQNIAFDITLLEERSEPKWI